MVYSLFKKLNSTTVQNGDIHFNFRSQVKSHIQGQIQVYFARWLGEARGMWDGRPARGSALTSSIEVWGGVPEALLTYLF